MSKPSNRPYSSQVVDGLQKAAARAMLHAVGFTEADFSKPQVGIASTWSNLTPCNVHINELAEAAAIGVEDAAAKAITSAQQPQQRRHQPPPTLRGGSCSFLSEPTNRNVDQPVSSQPPPLLYNQWQSPLNCAQSKSRSFCSERKSADS